MILRSKCKTGISDIEGIIFKTAEDRREILCRTPKAFYLGKTSDAWFYHVAEFIAGNKLGELVAVGDHVAALDQRCSCLP